jgi:hypothetical protein
MSITDRAGPEISTRFSLATWDLVQRYRAIFHIDEIAGDTTLKCLSGVILLGFHFTFSDWMYSYATTVRAVVDGTYACWPLFQSCKSLIFMSTFGDGYSQPIICMGVFALMLAAVYAMYLQRWDFVHFIIFVLLLFKLYFIAISYTYKSNFNFCHISLCVIYLLCAHKRLFAQLAWVIGSFISTVAKIHPSWLLGQQYTSLKLGLPLFPAGAEAIIPTVVILMEMLGVWFLMSAKPFRQRAALSFFALWYVYSGLEVGYRFPIFETAVLLILFGPRNASRPPLLTRSAITGWSVIIATAMLQLVPHVLSAGERMTNEENIADIFGGPYAYEVNQQCYGDVKVGEEVIRSVEQVEARFRCDPYFFWFRASASLCPDASRKYHITYRRSTNGNPFRELVNESDLCSLTYHPLGQNAWIKDEKDAPMIGRPVQNYIFIRQPRGS